MMTSSATAGRTNRLSKAGRFRALQLIITRLESQHPTVGAACVATGAGVRGRPGYQPTGPMAITIQPRRPGGQP